MPGPTFHRSVARACGFGAILLVTLTQITPVLADMVLSLDGDYVVPIGEDDMDPGYGVGVRGGPRLDLKVLTLTPELVAEYRDLGGVSQPRIYQGMGGARLGVGAVIRPEVFAHIGVGHVTFDRVFDDRTSLAADVGLGLDLTILPFINVGAHGAYNVLAGSPTLRWANLGGHVTFVF